MEEEGLIDVPEENPNAGLPVAIREAPIPVKPPVTAAQAKVEAIADLTHAAYQKAGTLNLTKEESEMLAEDFPDEAFKPGAAGKENLIYIEHAFLRDRFVKVFGMGGWAMVPRSRWDIPFKTEKGIDATTVYVEAMLVVRGCFVAEAIGDMVYYPKNQSTNYGDAVEGAESAAFRRCAKKFGVGLQAWKKDWCQGWWDRKMAPGKRVHPATPAEPKQQAPKPELKMPTEATRKWMIKELKAGPGEANTDIVHEYFVKIGQLLPTESVEDLALRFVPFSKKELEALVNCLSNFEAGGDAVRAFDPHSEATEPEATKEVPRGTSDEPWRDYPMPWGQKAGVKLGDLDKKYLYGLWANHKVTTEYKGKPKKPETIAKDQEFRAMLDLAGAHYKFEKKD